MFLSFFARILKYLKHFYHSIRLIMGEKYEIYIFFISIIVLFWVTEKLLTKWLGKDTQRTPTPFKNSVRNLDEFK